MKKVCIFCETWKSGGIESFLHNTLLHMDRHELEIDIVAAELHESVFTKDLEDQGIRFVSLSGSQRHLRKNHALFRQLLSERHYDVVHLNIYQGVSLYYSVIAKQKGVPVRIAHSHNTALRRSPTRWLKSCLHCISKKLFSSAPTDFWACSKAAADFLFPRTVICSNNWKFIPNGIDTERFRFRSDVRQRVRRELSIENDFVIGNVGRLCYQKNQSFLLDMLAEAKKKCPGTKLLLVGEGEDLYSLEERARSLHIESDVLFYGVSDRVEELLWAMDAFAFPSRFEGLGIVAIEAQASGLPTICSGAVPGEAAVTDLFFQVPLNDSLWAKEVFRKAGADTREKMSMAIREAGFDVSSVAKDIRVFYEQ